MAKEAKYDQLPSFKGDVAQNGLVNARLGRADKWFEFPGVLTLFFGLRTHVIKQQLGFHLKSGKSLFEVLC